MLGPLTALRFENITSPGKIFESGKPCIGRAVRIEERNSVSVLPEARPSGGIPPGRQDGHFQTSSCRSRGHGFPRTFSLPFDGAAWLCGPYPSGRGRGRHDLLLVHPASLPKSLSEGGRGFITLMKRLLHSLSQKTNPNLQPPRFPGSGPPDSGGYRMAVTISELAMTGPPQVAWPGGASPALADPHAHGDAPFPASVAPSRIEGAGFGNSAHLGLGASFPACETAKSLAVGVPWRAVRL